jgi:hypothetical protein
MAKDIGGFIEANSKFEAWLADSVELDAKGLENKHEMMSEDAFPYLRATYFRWADTIERLCPDLTRAPAVLAVGDIHIENYGTWRNVEQRLVWGINDFDEAAHMPYAFDLVRLVTSAWLATEKKKLLRKAIARAILEGYRFGLKRAQPTVLDQRQTWMNKYLRTTDEERIEFRDDMDELKRKDGLTAKDVPSAARKGLIEAMPKGLAPEFAQRRAGVGSLGRPRYVGIAKWYGGLVVREAKAQLSSAWDWAHGRPRAKSRLIEAVRRPTRSPDPYLEADGEFVFRRLAADADKIGVEQLDKAALQANLFGAMGFDLGAYHGSDRKDARAIERDLRRRKGAGWLHHAADTAEEQVKADYEAWIEAHPPKKKRKKK